MDTLSFTYDNPMAYVDPSGMYPAPTRAEKEFGFARLVSCNGCDTEGYEVGGSGGENSKVQQAAGTIHVIAASDSDKETIGGIVDEANSLFEELDLSVRAAVYDEGENGAFSLENMGELDNYAVIGADRDAVISKAKSIDDSWSRTSDLDLLDYGLANKSSDRGIAIHYKSLPSALKPNRVTATEWYGGYVLPHEVGHHSGHISHRYRFSAGHAGDGIMVDGNRAVNYTNRYGFRDLRKPSNNAQYLFGMKRRYQQNIDR